MTTKSMTVSIEKISNGFLVTVNREGQRVTRIFKETAGEASVAVDEILLASEGFKPVRKEIEYEVAM